MPIDQAVSDFITGASRIADFLHGLDKILGGFEAFAKLSSDLGPGDGKGEGAEGAKDFALSSNLSSALSSAKDAAETGKDTAAE